MNILISMNAEATWFLVILMSVNLIPIGFAVHSVYGQASFSGAQPIVNDPSLKADLVFQGLQNPTSMAFLGPNDILVLEKDQGTVQRIVNGSMLPQPVLHVRQLKTKTERQTLQTIFLFLTDS